MLAQFTLYTCYLKSNISATPMAESRTAISLYVNELRKLNIRFIGSHTTDSTEVRKDDPISQVRMQA